MLSPTPSPPRHPEYSSSKKAALATVAAAEVAGRGSWAGHPLNSSFGFGGREGAGGAGNGLEGGGHPCSGGLGPSQCPADGGGKCEKQVWPSLCDSSGSQPGAVVTCTPLGI